LGDPLFATQLNNFDTTGCGRGAASPGLVSHGASPRSRIGVEKVGLREKRKHASNPIPVDRSSARVRDPFATPL